MSKHGVSSTLLYVDMKYLRKAYQEYLAKGKMKKLSKLFITVSLDSETYDRDMANGFLSSVVKAYSLGMQQALPFSLELGKSLRKKCMPSKKGDAPELTYFDLIEHLDNAQQVQGYGSSYEEYFYPEGYRFTSEDIDILKDVFFTYLPQSVEL